MATDNTEALLGGFRIGNTWAANRQRKQQNAIDNKYRSEAAQDRLKEGFGEDTVFGSDGKVDIIGSAAKRKIKQEAEARAAGAGFTRAWDGSQIDVPVPVMAPTAAAVPVAPVATPPVLIEEPVGIAPDAPGFVQVPDGTGGMMPVQIPAGGNTAPSGVVPEGVVAPVASPVARAPVPQSMPDMSGWTAPQIAAFMHAYPQAAENRRRTQQEIQQEANRMAMTEALIAGRRDNNKLDEETRLKVVEKQAEAAQKRVETSVAGRALAERIKSEAKQAVLAGAEPKLNTRDKRLVNDTAAAIANKIRIASSLENQINQVDDPTLNPAVKFAVAQSMYKTINSQEGKDAVNGEEADRIGALLNYSINPFEIYRRGKVLPDMDKFVEQVRLKVDELKLDAKDGDDYIKTIYSRYGNYNPDTPGGGPGAPASAPSSAPVELFARPPKVPESKWNAMTPEQKSRAVQLFK